jgi:Pyruvate/2-oxoacid:ferredoxin oxidoreductase delta subunit
MTEDIYGRLREFLDRMPEGFPATDGGVEIRILKKLFSPEDAKITMQLNWDAEELAVLAERLGMGEAEASEKLEYLAKRGLVFRLREGDKTKYKAYHFIVGIYEFQLNTIDKELSELVEEYIPYLGMSFFTTHKTQQMRVIPVDSAVEALTTVAPYNKVRELVKNSNLISVAPCICRKEQGLMGHDCDRPHEICLQYGDFAQYYIDNGMGREISSEEALKLLDLAEESSLVLCPTNAQELAWTCCCCKCCCGILRGLSLFENPADYVNSSYQARIDPELCSMCGTCGEKCQIEAINEGADAMEVDHARCIGCGLCVSACPEEAIAFVDRPDSDVPPRDYDETMAMIAKERGLG